MKREREGDDDNNNNYNVYIYIYIYMERERDCRPNSSVAVIGCISEEDFLAASLVFYGITCLIRLMNRICCIVYNF